MMETALSPRKPFAWVQKRDGRLVPFDPDKISQALFAAGESLGRPDPFLAHELTESVLHFLAAEAPEQTPTTAQIADLVIKVVRELGQPALARAFADGQGRKAARIPPSDPAEDSTREKPAALRRDRPAAIGPEPEELARWVEAELPPEVLAWQTAGACLRDYSLNAIFTRDQVSLYRDGLLILGGLETPLELAGQVLPPGPPTGHLIEALQEARRFVGGFLALDGLEHWLAPLGSDPNTVAAFFRELDIGLRSSRLQAVLNLNSAVPPAWAEGQAMGPLFTGPAPGPEPNATAERTEVLLELVVQAAGQGEPLRFDWHLAQHDFEPNVGARLQRLMRRALEGLPLTFVFDRPRRPVNLAHGLDRQHSAALLTVALHLPRLAEQLGSPPETGLFLQKLTSLARLALSAATQKREFLRRHSRKRPGLTRAFLLDRARLVLVPVGLDAVTQALTGQDVCAGGAALDFARQVVQRLRQVLRQDAQAYLLDACLDADTAAATGVTPWDAAAPLRTQIRTAGLLHAGGEAGTVTVLLNEDRPPTPEEGVDLLRHAWQQTEVARVRFWSAARLQRQLTAPWETSVPAPGEMPP
jgi:hypothetical protein